jgi:hypothetical protein
MHRRVHWRGVPLRELGLPRPSRTIGSSSLAESRPAALMGTALRRFAPACGCRGISAAPGPRVLLSCASAPILFRRVGCAVARWTSGLQLPPAVRFHNTESWIDPAMGFASCRVDGRDAAQRIGLDPDPLTSLRSPRPRCSCGRALLSALGFAASFPEGDCRPFSVLMGLMPRRPDELRVPARAGSLSEVLHRP